MLEAPSRSSTGASCRAYRCHQAKLGDARTGDSATTKNNQVRYGKPDVSTPYTTKRYKPKNKADVDKISQAFAKMMQEDLTMKAVNDSTKPSDIAVRHGRPAHRYYRQQAAGALQSRSRAVPSEGSFFRETIRKNSDVEAKYKKQSGGHGQYGHVKMRFSTAGDLEKPYVFEQEVVGGAVPKNYFPAVEKRYPGSRTERPSGCLSGSRRQSRSI